MSALTEQSDGHQVIIDKNGDPAFVVVPYDEYMDLIGAVPDDKVTIPHEVVVLEDELDCSLIRAWREHLGLTQAELARRMDVSAPAVAQMEAKNANPRIATLKKLAKAMGIMWEQLRD